MTQEHSTQTWCVILAGGASARFWPVDGDDAPKYLLRPDGGLTLIEMAWERALSVTTEDRVIVVTGQAQAEIVAKQLRDLPPANVVIEPSRRDTLPAIGLGMAEIRRRGGRDGDAVVVTPSDTWLSPIGAMGEAFARASKSGVFDSRRLCCVTVPATAPKTGFGYLELRDAVIGDGCFEVARFVEKPSVETAMTYVESGRYHWNLGSFACSLGAFVAALEGQHPGASKSLGACAEALFRGDDRGATESFSRVPLTSVDYGLMERAESVVAIPVHGEFDDIGTWDALSEKGGLIRQGDSRDGTTVVGVDSSGCEAYGAGTVAFVGCDDLVVVRDGDRTLVMRKGFGQSVKQARLMVEEERRKLDRTTGDKRRGSGNEQSGSESHANAVIGVHLCVDLGDVRTGIAMCDDLGLLASPVELIRERDREVLANRIIELVKEHRAVRVVMGMPFNMDGTEGDRATIVREFAEMLRSREVTDIVFHDERLTSWEAEGRLREAGHRGRERKQMVDMAAAVTILEAYLSGVRKARSAATNTIDTRNPGALEDLGQDMPWQKSGWQKPGFSRDKLSPDARREKNREQRSRKKGK